MGAPGTGKTTDVRTWTNTLNKQSHKIVYLTLSTVSVADFFGQLRLNLGINQNIGLVTILMKSEMQSATMQSSKGKRL